MNLTNRDAKALKNPATYFKEFVGKIVNSTSRHHGYGLKMILNDVSM